MKNKWPMMTASKYATFDEDVRIEGAVPCSCRMDSMLPVPPHLRQR